MSLNRGASRILGKRIIGVVAKEGNKPPRSQVFLLFEDATYYEFYCDMTIEGTADADPGGLEEVLSYIPRNKVVLKAYIEPSLGPQLELPQ